MHQLYKKNHNDIITFNNNLMMFNILTNSIYQKISSAQMYYPNFYEWYHNNVIPSLINGDKEFIFEFASEKIVGLSIIKHSEKKLCHLSIFDEHKNRGYGLRLFEKSFISLKTDKPFLTVSEEKYLEFKKIFDYYGFELTDKKLNLYRENKMEYFFNE